MTEAECQGQYITYKDGNINKPQVCSQCNFLWIIHEQCRIEDDNHAWVLLAIAFRLMNVFGPTTISTLMTYRKECSHSSQSPRLRAGLSESIQQVLSIPVSETHFLTGSFIQCYVLPVLLSTVVVVLTHDLYTYMHATGAASAVWCTRRSTRTRRTSVRCTTRARSSPSSTSSTSSSSPSSWSTSSSASSSWRFKARASKSTRTASSTRIRSVVRLCSSMCCVCLRHVCVCLHFKFGNWEMT